MVDIWRKWQVNQYGQGESMQFVPTNIPEVIEIRPKVHTDKRGFFMETYQQRVFAAHGIHADFVQDNHSFSQQHILRGLHYQTQHTQGKLVRVLQGEVFDVAVDVRANSASFGQWVGVVLSGECKNQLWVPPGFAHGFYVMSEYAEFVYKCTDFYAPEYECSIRWDDQTLNISWPVASGATPLLSAKDQAGRAFDEIEALQL